MSHPIRVLSLYEGFFAGGARILHTDVIVGLHGREQQHSVLSLTSEARREGTVQRMQDDPRYQRLADAGVPIHSLAREAGATPPERHDFTDAELQFVAGLVADADVVVCLKEQPLGVLLALRDRGMMPDVPVIVCLHRSDPTHSGAALSWLVEASQTGLVTSTISCAESTRDAYLAAGVEPAEQRVVANGIDTQRFTPGSSRQLRRTRRALGIHKSAPVVVFAARFDAMKDPGLFLRAVAEHSARRDDTHYVMCGAGMTWENDAFRYLVEASGITDPSRLHPLGIRNDMPRIYQVADIVALTSAFGEASPLCLLEGAACGATPVTTDVGDAARATDGIGLVTAHDAAQIAAAWDLALSQRPMMRRASLSARPHFGRERMVAQYRSAIASARATATITAPS
ncbi:glycosyltransferase [Marisediminicola senii]|uniref:glycosyltransferase n=1 Tax=Marisediminicola senii TaxID=2711233 RepID=UPI0013E9DDB5|nr:glycosyltransferase [Marisediminicola senii]